MNKNTKILIGVTVVLIVLVCLYVFSKKEENKSIDGYDEATGLKVGEPRLIKTINYSVNGYTREEYASMGYSKADIDLMFS